MLGLAPGDRALVGRIGYQPDGPLPFADLSAAELLALPGDTDGPAARHRGTANHRPRSLDHVGFDRGAHAQVHGTFSTGMTRRLAIATALLGEP